MKHTIVAFLSALLFVAFTPANALADDHHRHHHYHDRDWERDHDRYVYHHYHHRGHSVYREAHWAWIDHHRVWVPARTVVIYF